MDVFNRKSIDHFKTDEQKAKPDWFIPTFNILSGIARSGNNSDLVQINNTLNGVLDKKDYNSFMNPFNFKEDRHKHIPGKLRNYDIILNNLRRYIGEYITSYQEFHVVSSLPDEDNELLDAANELAYKLLSDRAVSKIKAMEAGESEEGGDQDIASSVETFKSRWKDNRVINDFNMLEYIKSFTDDAYLYGRAYFHWVTYGRYFIERRVYRDDIVKTIIEPMNAFPIVTDKDFVEDYEGFLIESTKSISQIFSEYGDYLESKDKDYLKAIEREGTGSVAETGEHVGIITGLYKHLDGMCNEVESVEAFSATLANISCSTLYYKGFTKIQILKYEDQLGNTLEMEVNDDYELDIAIGDIDLTTEWYPLTYVQYRFGSKTHGVYTKPHELEVQRQQINNNAIVKLPITGKVGIYPGFPNHSIVKILFPFQLTINLLEMAKERAIVTAQGKIAILPKELLGSNAIAQEEEMYNMLVMKKLLPTVGNITNLATTLQAIKTVDLTDSEYIKLLAELIVITKDAANEAIDMNRQRIGNSYASDGKGATEDAAARMSIGSAVINNVFDLSRCKDYEADIDYSKVAWIKGKKAKFITSNRHQAFFEVNPVQHAETEYGINVTTAFDYDQQAKAIKEYAFSLGQNGIEGADVILDVITNKNISKLEEVLQISKAVRETREKEQFAAEQETRKVESQNILEAEQIKDKRERDIANQSEVTKLLIAETQITIKALDMEQEDKNNEVLKNVTEQKQKLQAELSILQGR